VSDEQLQSGLADAGVSEDIADAVVSENEQSRIDGLRVAISLVALLGIAFTGGLPVASAEANPMPRAAPTRAPAGP
jgi:hypothetical protein